MSSGFFTAPEEHSLVKARIVAGYFKRWAAIIARHSPRLGYFDFYAGPGRYGSGEMSTPLLILQSAIADPSLRDRLVCVLNDSEPSHTRSLQQEIAALPGYETLKFRPDIRTGEVDEGFAELFESRSIIPALSFMDPWGYKGLSLRLIHALLKDWGCEVVFFFNYNRINMGIQNPMVDRHMRALFGDRLDQVRVSLEGLSPTERESALRRELGEALRVIGGQYLIPFRFGRRDDRASHYICFVTKSPIGYEIMKDVMAREGVADDDGVPRFEYIPPMVGRQLPFALERPFQSLAPDLAHTFAGRTVRMDDVYHEHNVGTPFIRNNYKAALLSMEQQGQVTIAPAPGKRRQRSRVGDDVLVTFPRQDSPHA